MAMKNTAEVVIAGKVYKISGYESPEYLHQIAVYLNDKMSELQKAEGYRKQNADQKQLLLNMNLADDFFKSRHQAEQLTADLEKKERELYSVRHDLIDAQLALENKQKELDDLKEKAEAQQKELEILREQQKELEKKKEKEEKTGGAEENTAAHMEASLPENPATASPAQTQGQNQNQSRQNHSHGRRYHSGNK